MWKIIKTTWILAVVVQIHLIACQEPQPKSPKRISSDFIIDEDSSSNEFDDFNVLTSYIEKGFTGSRSFGCPKVKSLLQTGTNVGNLSPEDIDIVATMGDAIATGIGLWPGTDVEFRGAVFTTGGDANIEGVPTVSNIILEFNPLLEGISHGMGSASKLPRDQLNVAHSGAETDNLQNQAQELVRRLHELDESRTGEPLSEKWVMVFVTIGTEELCGSCDEPHIPSLRKTLTTLRKGIPNAIVVLIGPVHVSKSSQQTYNLLKPRCPCLSRISDSELRKIQRRWRDGFLSLEEEFNKREYITFEVLTLPLLQITSRYPEQLFLAERPLLNRRGHAYAAKWLWNRLISGPKYNASKLVLSEEAYYCPSLKCPYFRTSRNLQHCVTMTISEYNRMFTTTVAPEHGVTRNYRLEYLQDHIGWYIGVAIFLCLVSVSVLGTLFYCHGMKQNKGRFENVPGPDDLAKFMLAGKEPIEAVQRYFYSLEADKKKELTLKEDEWFLGSLDDYNAKKHTGLALFKFLASSIIPFVEELYIFNTQLHDYSFLRGIKKLARFISEFADEEHIKVLSALSSLQIAEFLSLNIKDLNLQLLSTLLFSFNYLLAKSFIFEANPKCNKVFQATCVWLFGNKELKNDFVFNRQNYQNYFTIFPNVHRFYFEFYVKVIDVISDLMKVASRDYCNEVEVPNQDIFVTYQFFDYSGYPNSKVLKLLQGDRRWATEGCSYDVATAGYQPVKASCSFPLVITEVDNYLAKKLVRRIPENSNGKPEDYYQLIIRNWWKHKADFQVLKNISIKDLLKAYGEIIELDHNQLYFGNVEYGWISDGVFFRKCILDCLYSNS